MLIGFSSIDENLIELIREIKKLNKTIQEKNKEL